MPVSRSGALKVTSITASAREISALEIAQAFR
jgi:hypothetical protein